MTPDQELMDAWVTNFGQLKPHENPKHWYEFIRKSHLPRLYRAIDSIAADPKRNHAAGLEDLKKHYWRITKADEEEYQTDERFAYHNQCKGSGMLPVLNAGETAALSRPWPLTQPLPAQYYRSESWVPCSCDRGRHINRYGLKGTGSSKGFNYAREFLEEFRGHFAHDAGVGIEKWIEENTIPEEVTDATQLEM